MSQRTFHFGVKDDSADACFIKHDALGARKRQDTREGVALPDIISSLNSSEVDPMA